MFRNISQDFVPPNHFSNNLLINRVVYGHQKQNRSLQTAVLLLVGGAGMCLIATGAYLMFIWTGLSSLNKRHRTGLFDAVVMIPLVGGAGIEPA